MSFEAICALMEGETRKATARCVFGYFDGQDLELFEGSMDGTIAETPAGENGFGWDKIFIPHGYTVTRASLGADDDQKTYLQMKPLAKLKAYLESKSLK